MPSVQNFVSLDEILFFQKNVENQSFIIRLNSLERNKSHRLQKLAQLPGALFSVRGNLSRNMPPVFGSIPPYSHLFSHNVAQPCIFWKWSEVWIIYSSQWMTIFLEIFFRLIIFVMVFTWLEVSFKILVNFLNKSQTNFSKLVGKIKCVFN